MTNDLNRRDLFKYAWDYFHFHASQRLTTFNFYLVICGLIIAGYATALKDNQTLPVAIGLGVVLVVISFVFWKLDQRNRQMIWNSEEALKKIEDTFENAEMASPVRVFRYEEAQYRTTVEKASRCPWWPRVFTFSVCFGIVFVVFAISGAGAAFYAGAKMATSEGRLVSQADPARNHPDAGRCDTAQATTTLPASVGKLVTSTPSSKSNPSNQRGSTLPQATP